VSTGDTQDASSLFLDGPVDAELSGDKVLELSREEVFELLSGKELLELLGDATMAGDCCDAVCLVLVEGGNGIDDNKSASVVLTLLV